MSNINFLRLTIFMVTITFSLGISAPAFAESADFEITGWIPYWRDAEGVKDAKKHLSNIDRINPFVFTVTSGGELRDQAKLEAKEWQSFFKSARRAHVAVVPTVMWSDGASIQKVLVDDVLRAKHISGIVTMVKDGNYDGVDIDYESKKSESIDDFSVFLKELKSALGEKLLTCTVEARTPPESLYKEIPKTINYANDYKAIGTYCDRVEIMAYDQQRADIKLNAERTGAPYIPLSDIDWVKKVVLLALKDIPKEKIMLGIPTYGYHYAVTVAPEWYRGYTRLGALNVPGLLDIAKKNKATPSRNKSGEMSFTYLPKDAGIKFPKDLEIPKNTPKGNLVAAKALAYATKTGTEITFNIGWYSDSEAILNKVKLAEDLGLRGVSLFKIDGEEDQRIWKTLK